MRAWTQRKTRCLRLMPWCREKSFVQLLNGSGASQQVPRWAQANRRSADVQGAGPECTLQPFRRSDRVSDPRPAILHVLPSRALRSNVPRGRFLGLSLRDRFPNAKTVWLYRDALAQAGKVEELFRQFDGHLARQGYIAQGGQILDASIVPVSRNHNTRDENAAIKKGEVPEDWADKPAKRMQKDVDAR
jgi:hypothetical protein